MCIRENSYSVHSEDVHLKLFLGPDHVSDTYHRTVTSTMVTNTLNNNAVRCVCAINTTDVVRVTTMFGE